MPMGTAHAGYNPLYALIGLGVALAIILLRNRRPRTLRVELLWIMPAIILIAGGSLLWAKPPTTALEWIGIVVALGLGGAAGWWRGKLMRLEVHPETHAVTAQASPLGLILVLALFVLRNGLRVAAEENPGAFPVNALQISEWLVMFAIGLIALQRVEMGLRARKMIAAAQAAKAAA